MQTTIPEVTAERARVARLSVGQVQVGPIRIGQLLVTGAAVHIHAGQARMQGVHVTTRLEFRLVWSVQIPMPWPFDDIKISETTTPLGTLALPLPFGEADVPGLQDIELDVPQLVASGATVAADPLVGVQLTDVTAEAVRALDLRLPTAGFQLSGLGLTGMDVTSVGVPALTLGGVSVGRVSGTALALPALRLRDLALPAAAADDITSGAIELTVDRTEPFAVPPSPLDLGILTVGLRVFASADMHVDRMTLSGVRASATAQAVELRDVVLPYAALDVTLADLGVDTVAVPQIAVA